MPVTREDLEERERRILAPYAQSSRETRGRKHEEAPPEWRTDFQRDRDRVIHSRAFRVNEDLAETIALAHDLGHSPFGHKGEHVLDRLMRKHGGFEHNRHSLRIVEEIEQKYPDFPGLNLTWEVREGLLKHNKAYI